MTSRIDELIEARLAAVGVSPAAIADDAELFTGRLSLDLNGCIPTLVGFARFTWTTKPTPPAPELALNAPMDGANNAGLYTRHFTNVWRRILLWSTPAQQAVAGSLEASGEPCPEDGFKQRRQRRPVGRALAFHAFFPRGCCCCHRRNPHWKPAYGSTRFVWPRCGLPCVSAMLRGHHTDFQHRMNSGGRPSLRSKAIWGIVRS